MQNIGISCLTRYPEATRITLDKKAVYDRIIQPIKIDLERDYSVDHDVLNQIFPTLVSTYQNTPLTLSHEDLDEKKDPFFSCLRDAHLKILQTFDSSGTHRLLPATEQNLSCYEYALAKQGILKEGDRDIIRAGKEKLHELFRNRGFQVVLKPQEGDLVLFLKENTMTHLGIYKGEGKISSKEGNAQPHVTERPLEDLPLLYGDQILYYRRGKSALSLAQKVMLASAFILSVGLAWNRSIL